MADPAIILVSEHHADTLLEEFRSRYQRDYDLRTAGSCAEAESIAREIRDRGDHVALFVTDSRLPDVESVHLAFHRWRLVVADARRVVAAHWDYFLADAPGAPGRHGQGQVRRLPAHAAWQARRGVPQRDHRPALRVDLDRPAARGRRRQGDLADPGRAHHGDPRLPGPDGHAEPALASRRARAPGLPGGDPRAARGRGPALARGRRGQPDTDPGDQRPRRGDRDQRPAATASRSTRSSTSRSSAAARPVSPRPCTARPRACRSSCWRPRRSAARPAPAR